MPNLKKRLAQAKGLSAADGFGGGGGGSVEVVWRGRGTVAVESGGAKGRRRLKIHKNGNGKITLIRDSPRINQRRKM